jgi:serine/threonine protein kinase
MPIVDSLILAADVSIVPVGNLSVSLRRKLGAKRGDFAITRLRGRAPAQLVDRFGASLLREFRDAKPVATAVLACAGRHGLDPEALLAEAFPLLRDCFNSRFLAVAGSPEASRTLPTRDRGDTIGRYTVLRCLHVVDDAELYHARAADGLLVAIKLARPGTSSDRLFARETAVLRHLGGDGVPALRARGKHDGRPWFAMTWCEGIAPEVAAAELRDSDDDASRARLLRLLRAIVASYARLHAAGVLHGDVHLRNMVIGRRDDVHLLDFALARAISPLRLAGQAGLGAVPQLFTPEQAAALLAHQEFPVPTVASEQHAIGAVLYCLATGVTPFDLDLDRRRMLRQIVRDPMLPFARRGAAPWPALEAVLARALAKSPGDRFGSVAEMHDALASMTVPRRPRTTRGSRARDPLDGVVERFLDRVDHAGPAFAQPGPAPTCSLMLGRTGVAYALYRLACLRDDPATLALADAWLTRSERDIDEVMAFTSPSERLDFDAVGPVSPFHSVTGVHLVRVLLALAMNDEHGAARAVAAFVSRARTAWDNCDLTLGITGVPLACSHLLDALPAHMTESAALLRATGREVLARTWREIARQGPAAQPTATVDFGAAHGWAGMLFASIRWHQSTGDAVPPMVRRRLTEVARAAEPLGRGVHWPQPEAAPTASVWATHQVAGWCNGPAGFIPLWTLADIHFPRGGYGALAEACAWSTWEARSAYFDLCCGLVGRSYCLLNFYRHTGRSGWVGRAQTLARRAVTEFAATRSALQRPLGLFKGEAGLAVLAADLRRPETAAYPLIEPEGFPGHAAHG